MRVSQESGYYFLQILRRRSVFIAGASKAAVDQLTRIMALELGPHQVNDWKFTGKNFTEKKVFFFVISNLLHGHISLTVIEHPLLTVLDDLWTTKLIDTLPLSSVLRIVFFDIF